MTIAKNALMRFEMYMYTQVKRSEKIYRLMEVVLLNQISKKQKNLMDSSQMYSPKRYTPKSHFWIGRPHSWMKLLLQRKE